MSSPLPPLPPRAVRRTRAPRKASVAAVYNITPAARHQTTCKNCEHLPAGSMEVAALLLVLVFSLSAVLFTSVYATKVQSAKVSALEAQVSAYQHLE